MIDVLQGKGQVEGQRWWVSVGCVGCTPYSQEVSLTVHFLLVQAILLAFPKLHSAKYTGKADKVVVLLRRRWRIITA